MTDEATGAQSGQGDLEGPLGLVSSLVRAVSGLSSGGTCGLGSRPLLWGQSRGLRSLSQQARG